MTASEACEQQLITQIGNACLTIAKQAGAVTELQNTIAERDKIIAEQAKEIETLKALQPHVTE